MSHSYPDCGCGCGCTTTRQTQASYCYNGQCGPICPFDSITALQLDSINLVNYRVAITLGAVSPFDGDGHLYIFLTASTDAADSPNVIKPNVIPADQPGRWKLIM